MEWELEGTSSETELLVHVAPFPNWVARDGGGKEMDIASVPLGEMFGYSTTLRSLSQGRAVYTMQFAQYEEVPKSTADDIMAASGKKD